MTDLLPYMALGLTSAIMLFGNNIVGNSNADSTEVHVALAIITQNQEHQRKLSEQQLQSMEYIEAKVNENSKNIAVLAHAVKSNSMLTPKHGP